MQNIAEKSMGYWIGAMLVAVMGVTVPQSALAHGNHKAASGSQPHNDASKKGRLAAYVISSPAVSEQPQEENDGEKRWLAGDHHIHSRYSVGWDKATSPPTPKLGGDAIYPIPMNAIMARRHGLSWMVATDHGGANHSKINHDYAYPELLESRKAVPEVLQFFGMEFDTPGADHSSVIVPAGDGEAERLYDIEFAFGPYDAWPLEEERNTEPKMLEALRAMNEQPLKPLLFAHHPSRSATALGEYGLTTPAELRNWNDTAPDIAVGMEGAPGHQAAVQTRRKLGAPAPKPLTGNSGKNDLQNYPRGAYSKFPTVGGFDQMTARLGGFWDSMLGEGRRWWITANSDSHTHWTEGGIDFWPGEYSKTYVYASKDYKSVLEGLRSGRIFVTTGDLISDLDFTASSNQKKAMIGEILPVKRGADITITIAFHDPDTRNANGDNPTVSHIDLIRGNVAGPVSNSVPRSASQRDNDTNPTTRVEARFTRDQWQTQEGRQVVQHTLKNIQTNEYIRLRGTNTEETEPQADIEGESPWQDLWFYSNPIFVKVD